MIDVIVCRINVREVSCGVASLEIEHHGPESELYKSNMFVRTGDSITITAHKEIAQQYVRPYLVIEG